ncbi:MAG: SIS domain-containing protein [Saprospiraceae bacterium]|nr:SIS domain-containing protein [Saprospiraceae bacterium]
MNATSEYLKKSEDILSCVAKQTEQIKQGASWCSESIKVGRVVHLFGSGHSRIMVEEMWPRYGSFPGFNPIVEMSLTFHNQVVGANGQRQAMFLENTSGLAAQIMRNFAIDEQDCAIIISSSGCSVVAVEMAFYFQQHSVKVIGIITKAHSQASESRHPAGKKLQDYSDLVLDTGAPAGDAMISIPGLDTPVSPGSTLGGVLLVNCLKAEIAKKLTDAGQPPTVLTAPALAGSKKSSHLFQKAYDHHGSLMSKILDHS